MADTPAMFASTRGFWGWPIQWHHVKCCGADPCCHGNEILAHLGYFCTKSPTLLQIDSSFLFLDGIEPFLARHFSVWHSTKLCSYIFDLCPVTPKFAPQNFGTKSPITRLVRQMERTCLHPLGDFWGWPIQRYHTKCCGANPCCHGNEILANLGYYCTRTFKSILLFCFSTESNHFLAVSFPCGTLQNVVLRFLI